MHMMIKLLSTLQYCIKPSFVYDVIAGMFPPVLDYHHGNILLQYGEFVLENITLLIKVKESRNRPGVAQMFQEV